MSEYLESRDIKIAKKYATGTKVKILMRDFKTSRQNIEKIIIRELRRTLPIERVRYLTSVSIVQEYQDELLIRLEQRELVSYRNEQTR